MCSLSAKSWSSPNDLIIFFSIISESCDSQSCGWCEVSLSLLTCFSLRLSSWQVFSIVVFATITAEGYMNIRSKEELTCMFNSNNGACNFGVGIGVLAFLACVIFLVLDAYFPQISNAMERKGIVLGDLVFSGKNRTFLLTSHESMSHFISNKLFWLNKCFHHIQHVF